MREEALEEAADVLRRGGLLIHPTETVYGLGCDPAEARAVARVRALKGREAARPMLALTDRWARVQAWIGPVSEIHRRLMEHEPPLPLTLVFEAAEGAPPALLGPEGTLALRRTSDPFCRALIAAAGRPLLSTSANLPGRPPPSRFEEIDPALVAAADLAVDAGRPLAGTPSTVARIEGGRLVVLREGAAPAAELERIARGEESRGEESRGEEPKNE